LKSGEVYQSNFTVLATGNLDNTLYQELFGYKGYFPYHYSDEAGIRALINEWKQPEIRVLVLGTRLGGIDATLFLKHLLKNHETVEGYTITMASRQAQLPMVRIPQDKSKMNFKYLNNQHLAEVINASGGALQADTFVNLFEKELNEALGTQGLTIEHYRIPNEDGEHAKYLRNDIAEYLSGKSDSMQVRFALLEVIDLAWVHMSDAEKAKLAQHYMQPMLRIVSAFPV